MKTLLRQLQDLHHQLHYATRNDAAVDKALKQVYAILIAICQEIVAVEGRLNDNRQKHTDPYNPGVGSVCGSEALRKAARGPIGEDHED